MLPVLFGLALSGCAHDKGQKEKHEKDNVEEMSEMEEGFDEQLLTCREELQACRDAHPDEGPKRTKKAKKRRKHRKHKEEGIGDGG